MSFLEEKKKEETQKRSPGGRVHSTFDFEALYELYPRKRGKKKGLWLAERSIKTAAQYDRLKSAIQNYALECRGKEIQYVRYFDRFMVDWEDWVEREEVANQVLHHPEIEKIHAMMAEEDRKHG